MHCEVNMWINQVVLWPCNVKCLSVFYNYFIVFYLFISNRKNHTQNNSFKQNTFQHGRNGAGWSLFSPSHYHTHHSFISLTYFFFYLSILFTCRHMSFTWNYILSFWHLWHIICLIPFVPLHTFVHSHTVH